jgi:tetratricopeptide (TPR) repeat protein
MNTGIERASENEATVSDARDTPFGLFAVSGVAWLVLVLFVFLYGTFGGKFVAGVTNELGEALASKAQARAEAGDAQAAIQLYRSALDVHFSDPQQRIWSSQRLARLLIGDGQYEEAANVMEQALKLDNQDSWNYNLLCDALRETGLYDRALARNEEWIAASRDDTEPASRKWAYYSLGATYRDMNATQKALDAFLASFEASPSAESAYQAALLYQTLGQKAEALSMIDYIVKDGKGVLSREAQQLKGKIEAGS